MRARMLAVVAAVLVATACGGGDGEPPRIDTRAPAETPSGTPAPDPLTASPPPGGVPVPERQVDASALPAGAPALVWTRGPRTLGVFGRAGGCTEARAEVAAQDAGGVTVRVVQETTSAGPCTRELRYPALEVTLDADLGERRVVLTG